MIKFKDFIDDGISYCKISKSCPDISDKCIEPFYKEYVTGKIVIGTSLSFVPVENAIDVLFYGDTFTEFDFSDKVANIALAEDEIVYRGGGFNEYSAKRLLVGNQYSLNEPWINAKIIANAKTLSLIVALESFLNNESPILEHYEKLNFNKSAEYWQNIAMHYSLEKKKGKSLTEAAKFIKELALKDLSVIKKPQPIIHHPKKEIKEKVR